MSYQHGNLCQQQEMSLTPVQGHLIYLRGPEEYHVCPRVQSKAGKNQHLEQKENVVFFYLTLHLI